MSEANGTSIPRPVPVPKGILKSSSNDPYEMKRHQQYLSGGPWDGEGSDMQMPLDSSNPGSGDLNSGLLTTTKRHKGSLKDFVGRKRDLLFRPLGSEVISLNDGTSQRNLEDHFAIVPSLDHFLRVDPEEIRNYFFDSAQKGDIVVGCVTSKAPVGIYLKFLCTDGGKHIVLEDLNIRSFCPASHLIPPNDSREPNRLYAPGDLVRCEIIEINAETCKVTVGMKGVNLSPSIHHSIKLGLIFRYDLPKQFALAKADSESDTHKTFEDILVSLPGFLNPNNVIHLASTMGVHDNNNSLFKDFNRGFREEEMASQLRKAQNGNWAHKSVADGIRNYKEGNLTEAFQCLNKALTIDAENVEGLVARGALYANKGNYEKAIEDLELAYNFNPTNQNARKYLADTLVAHAKQLEDKGKLEDAVNAYAKCLLVKPDHKEAREAIYLLHSRAEKIDPSKMSGVAAAKALDLKDKLKTLFATHLGYGKKKPKKEKKKRSSSASDDSGSSSSSSDSDSDSSSESEYGDKKKKKKKKRKSKKKRSKTTKESSLSPLGRRIEGGAPGIPLPNLPPELAEWGKQLGFVKKEKHDSDDEDMKRKSKKKEKRRKKKDRKKKKKHASSDSSSSDSDSSKEKKSKRGKRPPETHSEFIQDFNELEARLQAYYKKLEHDKPGDPRIPPESVKITFDHSKFKDQYDNSRKIVVEKDRDEYGYSKSMGDRDDKKFSMKVRGGGTDGPTTATTSSSEAFHRQEKDDAGKWKVVGGRDRDYMHKESDSKDTTKDTDDEKDGRRDEMRNYRGRQKSRSPHSRSRSGSRSRSNSRSRARKAKRSSRSRSRSSHSSGSRSPSRSPGRDYRGDYRDRRAFHYHNREGYRQGYQHHGYNHHNQNYYHNRNRGGGQMRFFRGYNNRNNNMRRPYGRGNYRGGGGHHHGGYHQNQYNKNSRFRNRFSKSYSRSRSRSRSGSRGRRRSTSRSMSRERETRIERAGDREHRDERDEDRSPIEHQERERREIEKSPILSDDRNQREEGEREPTPPGVSRDSPNELRLKLSTKESADMEHLEEMLDQRNALKKEASRENNPEFFKKW